ncbi:MAG: undecaprenyl-diphosphate phosphatase [Firmicutes bacterium]|nr:undecaprenyl-diphosphate phosphatase [Bacillota bacterium]
MNIFIAIFLGIVQGFTEFLPVSSSGHLILFQHIFNLGDDLLLFNILLHIATLLAVLFVFRKRIWELVKNPLNKTNLALVLATIVTVGFVLVFKDFIDQTMGANVLPITFMITAILLFSTTFIEPSKSLVPNKPITYTSALFTGLAQGIAVVPGFSRSGFTISTALFTGTNRERAAEFSFLMSIPIIIAALIYELISNPSPSLGNPVPLVLAFIAALVSGIFAIKFMLNIIKKVKLYWFSLYLVILSIVTIFLLYI